MNGCCTQGQLSDTKKKEKKKPLTFTLDNLGVAWCQPEVRITTVTLN